MYISYLMDSKPDFRCSDLGSLLGRGGYIYALYFFRDLMQKQWIGNRRKRFYGECGETPSGGSWPAMI